MKTSIYILLLILIHNSLFAQVSDFKSIDFTKADNIAKLNKNAPIDNLPLLAYNLTHKLSTKVEKFRAIYSWVCHNIKGDNTQHTKVNNKRKKLKEDSISFMKWNNSYKKIAFKKLRTHKRTMCTGYAYLIKELCYLAEIESVIIDGYGRSIDSNINELEIQNHSWNAVKLNKKWYLCDATWSSGYMNVYNRFVNEYNDGYFLTDPILFGKNHFPSEQKWSFDKDLTALAFVRAPMVYGETFEHKITPLIPKKLDLSIHKDDEIKFGFKTSNTILNKNISLIYYIGNEEKKLKIYNIRNENNIISFNCTFKNKGTYDTHLKINGDIVATYTIKVRIS
ncbi:transglutaminase domain-containing protein [Aquimarina pacifica]|uniref:transglutaminase domain-containing protein n=1 Tax=Aquimarina pacifica TaxID=1296415 RepID=UPI000472B6AE|nr:hypothetical protein [Aquimarina pacifica]